jgi:hypothetical protein
MHEGHQRGPMGFTFAAVGYPDREKPTVVQSQ